MARVEHTTVWDTQDGIVPGASVFKTVVLLMGLYHISYSLYALYLHPLHDFPGPKLSAISRIPYWIACLRGNSVRFMTRLHENYGPIVRFGPNDLSYTDGRAWRDIYVVQKGHKENGKDAKFYPPSANGEPSIFVQNDPARHATLRRVFSPAFSENALKRQEPMFQRLADMLVAKCGTGESVDMTKLYNFATFDIMGELAFGESLGLLENNEYSQWVKTVFESVKVLPFVQMIEFYPMLKMIFDLIEPRSISKLRHDHFHHTVTRVDKRLREGSDKQDIWNLVIESDVLTSKEMYINAELFMTAGTETTASQLTYLTYYLITNPSKMKLLTDEIRGAFGSSQEIESKALARLKYLNACIKEGLRIHPSVPTGLPREIPRGGNVVLGKWIPGGTSVVVHQTAAFRSSTNFKNPDLFVPERWLGDPEYKDDKCDAYQPFSIGTRNCIGMNMAWHEMRLLLAKVLFNFDIESDVGPNWADQDVYVIWDRKPLICRMRVVKG